MPQKAAGSGTIWYIPHIMPQQVAHCPKKCQQAYVKLSHQRRIYTRIATKSTCKNPLQPPLAPIFLGATQSLLRPCENNSAPSGKRYQAFPVAKNKK